MIGLGNREAGALVGKEKDTGRRSLDMLLDRGLIDIASDSTFGQKRLSREWRLTHLPDDRTGHAASKEFMKWNTEKQNIGAQVRSIGAQVRNGGAKTHKNDAHRRTGATIKPKSEGPQAHRCATSRSTISPEQQSGAPGVASPPIHPKRRSGVSASTRRATRLRLHQTFQYVLTGPCRFLRR